MRKPMWWLVGGTVLFLTGAAVVLIALERTSPGLARAGQVAILGAGLCFGMAGWRSVRRLEWKRVEAEQRLWESGPLGRAWLRIRKER